MQATCWDCGASLDADIAYCPDCGAAISDWARSKVRDAVTIRSLVAIVVLIGIGVSVGGTTGGGGGLVAGILWAGWYGNRKGVW